MITTGQALILAFLVFFAKSSLTPNLTYDWFKPLPASFFVGLVTGDMTTAVAAGISIQLVYMGYMVIGSVAPADITLGSIIGVALAVSLRPTMELEAAVAAGLSLAVVIGTPALVLGNLVRAVNTITNEKSFEYARKGEVLKQRLWYIVPSQILLFVIYVPLTFLVLRAMGSSVFLETMTRVLTPWAEHLSVVAKVLPAIGIALALRTITTNDTIPFLFIGFFLSAYLNVPLMGTVLLGVCVAVLMTFSTREKKNDNNNLASQDPLYDELNS